MKRLYSIWAIFFISAYAARSNLRFLIDVTPAIVGNANMLIYVRVGLGWAHSPSSTGTATDLKPIRFEAGQFKGRSDSIDEVLWEERKKEVGMVW
jgi:hypothetical protein